MTTEQQARELMKRLRTADQDGTVPCWVASEGADYITQLRADLESAREALKEAREEIVYYRNTGGDEVREGVIDKIDAALRAKG